ncbi:MAG: 30S ribosome-binding factor RbfA [Bacteroidota bacterium]|nr:30S ribosome-binding factor RbfA [Bacteroidota bacterium]
MNNLRVKKLSKQIQKDLSDILIRINKDSFQGKMLSISEVRLSPDLSIAKIYISVFPSKDADEVVEKISDMTNKIRFQLGNKIRHQVRKIPELRFLLDVTFDEIAKIDKLLNEDNTEE